MLEKKMEALYGGSRSATTSDHANNDAMTRTAPPWDCLTTEEEQAFLAKAIASERAMLSADFLASPSGLDALKESFGRAKANKLYCNVQLDTMLQEPAWQAFLPCLRRGVGDSATCNSTFE
jgi:hypothetical protein